MSYEPASIHDVLVALAQVRWEDLADLQALDDARDTLDDIAERISARIKQVESELIHPSQLAPVRRLRVVPSCR